MEKGDKVTNERYERLVNEAIDQQQHGWDFSFVDGRMIEDGLSWSYSGLANERLGNATAAVDLCTGGGELLSAVNQFPGVMYATESYKPNLSIAKTRLCSLGVQVVAAAEQLPADTFDLVLNRHGDFGVSEIQRVSKQGAIFLTQQVGSGNLIGLNQALGTDAVAQPWTADIAMGHLEASGFELIQCKEERPVTRFMDVGAIVFYLNAVSWQVPDFDLRLYSRELRQLHVTIENRGFYEVEAHRFLIEAKCPS
jgi:SAM-dependent methyltransferase